MATKGDPPDGDGPGRDGGGLSRFLMRLTGRGGTAQSRAEAELARRIDVPVLDTTLEQAEWQEIRRGFAGLADQGLWMSLLDRLRGVDQTRQRFHSGRRYFNCALAGAIAPITQHLGLPARVDSANAALAPLTTLHIGNLNDYMPAVVLARALIAIGWAARGPMPPGQTPHESRDAGRVFFARAEAVIESFDPIEHNSPMLAEARYRLAPGVEDGEKFLRDWYEDWADLDPSDPEMLAAHGLLLTPNWYGSREEIEREARRAVTRAADGLGLAAYPCFWRDALEEDPGAVSLVDADLFLAGIDVMLESTRSQARANEFAALLYRISLPRSSESREQASQAEPVRDRLFDGLRAILRRHLTELHGPIWGMEASAIRRAVSQAFEEEIADGMVLRAGETGIVAVKPG